VFVGTLAGAWDLFQQSEEVDIGLVISASGNLGLQAGELWAVPAGTARSRR